MRTLSIVGAMVLAFCLRKKLQDPVVLVWGCSAALALRCVTESVMVAYYLWPSLALASVLLARKTPGIAAFGAVAGRLPDSLRRHQVRGVALVADLHRNPPC